jgi:hypothetical protein
MTGTRKLAAILAADVAGYSKLAGSDEERTLARLRALRSRRNAVSPFKSIKAMVAVVTPPPSADPRVRSAWERYIAGLRKAGLPEE